MPDNNYYDSLLGDQQFASQMLIQDTNERMASLLNTSSVTNVPDSIPIVNKGYTQPDILQGNTEDIRQMQFSPDQEKAEWAKKVIRERDATSNDSILYLNGVGGDKSIPYDKSMDRYLNSKFGYDYTAPLEKNEQWNYDNIKMAANPLVRYGSDIATFLGRVGESTVTKFASTLGIMGSMIGNGVLALGGDQDAKNNYWGNVADNSFSRWVDGLDEASKNSWLKVWHDSGAKDNGFFANMGTEEFWNDKVADGLGFMASAMLLNYATAGLLSGATAFVGLADIGETALDVGGAASRTLAKGVSAFGTPSFGTLRTIATVGKVLNAGLKIATGAEDVGGLGAWALDTSMQAAWSATGTYKETYNDYINKGLTPENASLIASQRASSDFTGNLFALSLATAAENKMLFQPIRKAFTEKAIDGVISKTSTSMFGEGVENSQSIIGKAKLSSYVSDPDVGLKLANDIEYSSKIGKYLDLKNPYSRLRTFGSSALKMGFVDGLYKMNMQLAIDRMARYGEYDNSGTLDGIKNTFSQLGAQTINAFKGDNDVRINDVMSKNNLTQKDNDGNPIGADKESLDSITTGTMVGLIGSEFINTVSEFRAARGKGNGTERTNTIKQADQIRDSFNKASKEFLSATDIYKTTIDEGGKKSYVIGDDNKLVIDDEKVDKLNKAVASHLQKQGLSDDLTNEDARNLYQKTLLADLYHASIYAGIEEKLVGNLKQIENSAPEDLLQLGFNPTDVKNTPSDILKHLNTFAELHDEAFLSRVAMPKGISRNDYMVVDGNRKYELYRSKAIESIMKDHIQTISDRLTKIQSDNQSDPIIDDYNSLILQRNALKQFGDYSKAYSPFYEQYTSAKVNALNEQINLVKPALSNIDNKVIYKEDADTGLYSKIDKNGKSILPDNISNSIISLLKEKGEATNIAEQRGWMSNIFSDVKDGLGAYIAYNFHNSRVYESEQPPTPIETQTIEPLIPTAETKTTQNPDGTVATTVEVKDETGKVVATTEDVEEGNKIAAELVQKVKQTEAAQGFDDMDLLFNLDPEDINETDEKESTVDNNKTIPDDTPSSTEIVLTPQTSAIYEADPENNTDRQPDVVVDTTIDSSLKTSEIFPDVVIEMETPGDEQESIKATGQYTSEQQYDPSKPVPITPFYTAKKETKNNDKNNPTPYQEELQDNEYGKLVHRFLRNTFFDEKFLSEHNFYIVNDGVYKDLAPHKGKMYTKPFNTSNNAEEGSFTPEGQVIIIENKSTGKPTTIGEHLYSESNTLGTGSKLAVKQYLKNNPQYEGIQELPIIFPIGDFKFERELDRRAKNFLNSNKELRESELNDTQKLEKAKSILQQELIKIQKVRDFLKNAKSLKNTEGSPVGYNQKILISFEQAFKGVFPPIKEVKGDDVKITFAPINEVFKDVPFTIRIVTNKTGEGRFKAGVPLIEIKNKDNTVSTIAVSPSKIGEFDLGLLTNSSKTGILDKKYTDKDEAYKIIQNTLDRSFYRRPDKYFKVFGDDKNGYSINLVQIPKELMSQVRNKTLDINNARLQYYEGVKNGEYKLGDPSQLYWNIDNNHLTGKDNYTSLDGKTLSTEQYVDFIKDRLQTNLKKIVDKDGNVRMNDPVNSSFTFSIADETIKQIDDWVNKKNSPKEPISTVEEQPTISETVVPKEADSNGVDITNEAVQEESNVEKEEEPIEKSPIEKLKEKVENGEDLTEEEQEHLLTNMSFEIVDPTINRQNTVTPPVNVDRYSLKVGGDEYQLDVNTGVISNINNPNINSTDLLPNTKEYLNILDTFANDNNFSKSNNKTKGIAKEDFVITNDAGGFKEEGVYTIFSVGNNIVVGKKGGYDEEGNYKLYPAFFKIDNTGRITMDGKPATGMEIRDDYQELFKQFMNNNKC